MSLTVKPQPGALQLRRSMSSILFSQPSSAHMFSSSASRFLRFHSHEVCPPSAGFGTVGRVDEGCLTKRLTSLRKISDACHGQQMTRFCSFHVILVKLSLFGPQILLRKLKGIYLNDRITRKSRFGKFFVKQLVGTPSPPTPCLGICR